MPICSICGQVIEEGDHHRSTTDCICYLARRIQTLEAAVQGVGPRGPAPVGTDKGPVY